MIWENFKMALISIKSAKLRAFLTMLGIIIGIAAVVSINSIGEGVKKSVTDQISGLGSNLLTVTSGKTFTTDKNGKKTPSNFSAGLGASTLTPKDVASIGRLGEIKAVAPVMLISGAISNNGKVDDTATAIGTSPSFHDIVSSVKIDKGTFLNSAHSSQNEVVLGSTVKTDLFGDGDAVGKTITIRTIPFTVIGVMKGSDSGASSLSSAGSYDTYVYISSEAAARVTDNQIQILRIVAQAKTPGDVDTAVNTIKQAMLKNHGGQEDFSVLTQKDLVSTIGTILDLLSTFIAAIASIALLVGGIGIMNIMLVSVTERTREIGIRKAIGATRTAILTQFMIEALVLSLIGGALGILAAIGMATGAGKLAKITPVFTMPTIALAVGVSVGIGLIFGLAPAIKAARKRPIDALRYE